MNARHQGVHLNKSATSILVGGDENFVATVLPANATDKTEIWSSSSGAITISTTVEVTAVAAGTATITATSNADKTKIGTSLVTVIVRVDHVVSGNLKWAKGNLIAKNSSECKVGASIDGGLHFMFGSLVGWSGGSNGNGVGTGKSLSVLFK